MRNQSEEELIFSMLMTVYRLQDWLHAITSEDLEEYNWDQGIKANRDTRQEIIDLFIFEIRDQYLKDCPDWCYIFKIVALIEKLVKLLQDTRYSEKTHLLKCMYLASEIVVHNRSKIQKLLN